HDQCGRRERLADHGLDLHAPAQAAEGQDQVGRGDRLLPLLARERAGPGEEARLRPASGFARPADRKLHRFNDQVNPTAASNGELTARAPAKSGERVDRIFHLVTAASAWLVLLLLGGVAVSMAIGGRL